MNRRRFLIDSTAVIVGAIACRKSFGQDGPASAADAVIGDLAIDQISAPHPIPSNYCGLSYELAQLTDPNFFAASNTELIALFRLLSPQGVLRLGGNSSESCWFKADGSVTAPELPSVAGPAAENWMPQQLFMIAPPAIDHLADFLNATGWQLIYGLSFGHSSPERAAREAEYVAKKTGDQLLFFQIGNEPDFYHDPNNKTRPANWDFADYLREWLAYADAISQRVPNAKFGGPDVGTSSNWIARFTRGAAEKLGTRLVAVTGHYYAEGPPDNPNTTTARLLATNPNIASRTKAIASAAAKDQLEYRMTEGNSCYRGGKPGMSDAFASALWAGDYMLSLATAGCAGVNLHGGSRSVLRASLGNHMPGELVAEQGHDTKGGYYTPIAGEVGDGFVPRPIFYGMLLANQFAGTHPRAVSLQAPGVNATAYAGEMDGQLRVAIFNKDNTRSLQLTLHTVPNYKRAKVWRLNAPALDSTSGVALAGSAISPTANWSPSAVEDLQPVDITFSLDVPRASAALVFLDR